MIFSTAEQVSHLSTRMTLYPGDLILTGTPSGVGIARGNLQGRRRRWRETLINSAVMRKWLTCVGRRSALSCIAHMICEFVTRMQAIGLSDGVTCDFPMTQTELGDAAGLSTVHINRTLKNLRRPGLVTWGVHSVTIHDWAGLARVAQFDPLPATPALRLLLGSPRISEHPAIRPRLKFALGGYALLARPVSRADMPWRVIAIKSAAMRKRGNSDHHCLRL